MALTYPFPVERSRRQPGLLVGMPPHYTVVPRLLSTSLSDWLWVAGGSTLAAIEELPIPPVPDVGSLFSWRHSMSAKVEAMEAMSSAERRTTGATVSRSWPECRLSLALCP